ncbi:Uncharacterised protein [Mycobacteroides abscessus subsp. abscessus]|nr:Uncharacterised protein [Mycobacteroides abscessus subsp. abscessus]
MISGEIVQFALGEPGRHDVRGCQTTTSATYMRADPGERVKPQLAEPGGLDLVQHRGCPRPCRVKAWTVLCFSSAGVEFNGVGKWHG